MKHRSILCALIAVGCTLACERSTEASFIFMQIEQVVGGVNGDTSAQAIQLRMRFPGANNVEFARMRAWDAAGANPITLIDFTTSAPKGNIGDRILVTSPGFASYTDAAANSDFTLTNLIPASYLEAGRITYEGDDGTVYWLLSFGGTNYTGSTLGSSVNDPDGDFGPALSGSIPFGGLTAVAFQGGALDMSNSNFADYALTAGGAVFTNNEGTSVTIVPEPGALTVFAAGSFLLMRRRRHSTRRMDGLASEGRDA